jgi:hypothetical protein
MEAARPAMNRRSTGLWPPPLRLSFLRSISGGIVRQLVVACLVACLFAVGCQHTSPDGTPLPPSGQITMNEVPAVVRDGFRTQFPQAAIQTIDRATSTNGNVRYTFTFTGREGNKRQAKFDAKGHLLDTK